MEKLRKVKIKTWEEMEKEFGLDEYGDILVKNYFTKDMEYIIPKNRIIEIDKDGWNIKYRWWISKPMIAEYL